MKQPVSFKHGVHPPECKDLTSQKVTENMPLTKNNLIVPVSQHIGAPAKPEVSKKDTVKKGQIIASPAGFVSSYIHAPTSGTVVDIVETVHPVAGQGPAIIIKPDGKDEWLEGLPASKSQEEINKLTKKEIVELVKNNGIVGMGGATFPTHVKLSPPPEKNIEYVILNGAECEPYLTADHRLMLEQPEEILKGLELILKAVSAEKGIIGIETNKSDAGKVLIEKAKAYKNIEIIPCQTKYPQGAEKNLIYAILHREVPSGGLPMDVGVVVQNIGTALAIYEAAAYNKPLIERVVTVTGYGIKTPKNLKVHIGTPIQDLIEFCGGYYSDPGKIIMGGPMMGIAQYTTQVPVIKGTSGIVIFPESVTKSLKEFPCIRCAKCVDACPMFLLPLYYPKLVKKNNIEDLKEYNIMDCVECGSCAFVCPSRIPIVQYVKTGKMKLKKFK